MSIIKSVLGVIAVLFSIQPLLSWAAQPESDKSGAAQGSEKRDVQIKAEKPVRGGDQKPAGCGSPTCAGG